MMPSLEEVLGIELQNKGLINGDKLIATVKTDGKLKDNTYFFTAQGDIYYQNKEGELHQPVFNPKKQEFIEDKRTTVEKLNTKEASFSTKEEKELYELIKKESPENIIQETKWFVQQLKDEQPTTVKEEELLHIIQQYKPTNNSITPFGRETKNKTIVIKEDGEKISTDNKEIKRIYDKLSTKKEKKEFINELATHLTINKNVYFINGKKTLASFFHDHGLNNKGETHNSIFKHDKKNKTFWIDNNTDQMKITYEKVSEAPSFKRTTIPLEEIIGKPRFTEQINNWYTNHKIIIPKLHLKEKVEKAKNHIKKNAFTYIAGVGLAMGTLGFFSGINYQENKTPKITHETTTQVIEEKPVVKKTQEKNVYIVKKGDCLWTIAKEYATTNKEILEKTNEIAQENHKLTIAEYEQQKSSGETISKNENPNLIFPDDTLYIPTAKKETIKEEPDNKQEAFAIQKPQESIDNLIQHQQNKEAILTEREKVKKKKEKTTGYDAQLPTDYMSITKNIVTLKNEGKSLQNILDTYTGFNETTIKQAFHDYQGFVQAGMLQEPEIIKKYDNSIASTDFKNRIIHEYAKSNNSLRTLSQELSQEYGMHISASTISKYARENLQVQNRKEAKFINTV